MSKIRNVTISLEDLRAAGVDINQHHYDPQPDEWSGEFSVGPHTSAEAAVLAEIRALYQLYREYKELWEKA